jgi:toxin ParE1/3/4
MKQFSFTPEAYADLRAIALHIAADNPVRALGYVAKIEERCKRIAEFPNAGPPRPEWGDGVRIAVHGYYLIIYRVRVETVQVLRVIHGARDIDSLLESEPLPE